MGLTRSEVMSRIRGAATRPEELLRKALWRWGLRYRKNQRLGRVRPDVVFPGSRVVVFVDGCFWHGCPDHYVRPRSGGDFWVRKLRENVDRDIRQSAELRESGWVVIRIWEHEVFTDLEGAVDKVREGLCGGDQPESSWRVRLVEDISKPSDTERDLERRHMVDLWNPEAVIALDRKRSTAKW
jgi:DNA mismatch endonuclease (patch repair protein)